MNEIEKAQLNNMKNPIQSILCSSEEKSVSCYQLENTKYQVDVKLEK